MDNKQMDEIILKTAMTIPTECMRVSPDMAQHLNGTIFIVDESLPFGSILRKWSDFGVKNA